MSIWQEAERERYRARAIHGDKCMDAYDPTDLKRLAILMEEVGEVAKEFCDGELYGDGVDLQALRSELIQVCAMAGAWADAIHG